MSTRALVSSIAVATAVAVPVADAHTLSKATAKRQAARASAALVGDVGGSPVFACTRRSDHVVVCQVSVVGVAGDVCVLKVRVAHPSERTRRVSRRVISGPVCEPPELPGIL